MNTNISPFSFTLSCTVKCTSFVGTSAEIIFQHCERKKNLSFPICFSGNFSFIVVKCFDFRVRVTSF